MSAITKHRVCTSTLYPLVDKCVCKLNLVLPQHYHIWFCSVTIEQSHKSHTACVPYPTTLTFRTKMRTFLFSVVYCVIWDMCIVGFMKIVCSSLVQDQLHVITLQTYTWPVMAMGGCPTNLDRIRQFWFFLAGGGERGQWGKLFGNATFAGRNGRVTAPSNKICCGETFQLIQTKFGVPAGQ